jgi:signal transduction histidine kinase
VTVPVFAVPALLGAAALAVLAVRRRRGGWAALLIPVTLVVTVAALAANAYWIADPDFEGRSTSELVLTAELMVLAALVCRWAPPLHAVAVAPVVVLAEAALIVPITHDQPRWGWGTVGEMAFWSLAGLVGAASGWYLRGLDRRRADAVSTARRAQRVQLAADLHDYVAHDVSAMVVQAQAARVLLGDRAGIGAGIGAGIAPEVAAVLDRIEADGTRAIESMQRSIRVLREPDGSPAVLEPLPGIAEIPGLVRRYADAGDTEVRLRPEPLPPTELRGEAGNALYRVVLEALTNVRKHAGVGAEVTVELAAGAHAVTVTIDNTTTRRRTAAWTGNGLGLIGLRERVESFGGTFTAGPTDDGWRVAAELPTGVSR